MSDSFIFSGNTTPATIKRPSQYIWKPKPDITSYEVALALPIFHANTIGGWAYEVGEMVENLPPEVQRHFEKVA